MGQVRLEVAHEILRHLRQNPDASDTVEGITKWWLAGAYSTHDVRAGLAELVAAGLVTERRGENSHIHYRKSDAE